MIPPQETSTLSPRQEFHPAAAKTGDEAAILANQDSFEKAIRALDEIVSGAPEETDESAGISAEAMPAAPGTKDRRRKIPPNAVDQPRHRFTWTSPAAKKLFVRLEKIALLDSTALLTGESGTGKTSVARMIHERSSRLQMPFVAVNCASLPSELIDAELFGHARGSFTGAVSDRPGRADAADGGTLFLDEIGDLPLELQPKLLTFLQDRTFHRIGDNLPRSVDVRIIAATHRDLRDLCRQGVFREDLYFRLNVLGLHVPPLRERPHDIMDMAAEILNRICRQRLSAPFTLEPAAAEALQQYHWPGNVRELENVLENASAFCEDHLIRRSDLNLSDLPAAQDVPNPTLGGKTLAEIEKLAILDTLTYCDGNKAQAARVLGISEKSIYNKMRRHGLHPA